MLTWETTCRGPLECVALGTDDIYVGASDGTLYGLERESGAMKYQRQLHSCHIKGTAALFPGFLDLWCMSPARQPRCTRHIFLLLPSPASNGIMKWGGSIQHGDGSAASGPNAVHCCAASCAVWSGPVSCHTRWCWCTVYSCVVRCCVRLYLGGCMALSCVRPCVHVSGLLFVESPRFNFQ